MDRWHGLTLQDIREIEEKTREELNRVIFFFLSKVTTLIINTILITATE